MTTPNTAVDTTVADAIENSTMSSLKPTSVRMKRASIVSPSIGHFIAPYGTCIASTTKTIQATKHLAIGVGGGTDRMGCRLGREVETSGSPPPSKRVEPMLK